jgi:hypothetical protein
MKKMDRRLRAALLANDLHSKMMQPNGPEDVMDLIALDAIDLAHAILRRKQKSGFEGQKLNYEICNRIAQMQISVEQAAMVWSRDNIDSFDLVLMKQIEDSVGARRNEIPPRSEWPRCVDCGGLVHPKKSQDSWIIDGDRVYRCHKCVD